MIHTKTTTTNKMPTTAINASANANAQKKQQPMFEPEYPEYEEYEECTHVPFMNLTKEQRTEKSKNFKFGLCCDCDAGLDDKSEFVRQTRLNGDVKMCNACHNYHMDMFERNIGGEHGGCN